MKILFVSGLYASELITKLTQLSNGIIQNAPNAFQWAIVEGLIENKSDINVVSFPFLPGYPLRYKKIYTPSSDITYNGVVIGKMLPYNAFFLIKHLSIEYRLLRYLKKWIRNCYSQEQDIWIISYTPYSFFTRPIIKLKKKYPRLKYCCIIADLVDDATSSVFKLSVLKWLQAKREQRLVWSSYKHIDKYVLLSQMMEEKISNAKGRNVVVEGLASKVDDQIVYLKTSNIKNVLYTGTLQDFTGIMDLIEAFKMTVDSSYRLTICGDGNLIDIIRKEIQDDSRIECLGSIARNEALVLQKQATLLVNPRKPTVSLTRYSFPSKTMEYMASGTPMLGYHLDGIPSEYYQYMYTPKDLTIESLASTLSEVLSKSPEELQFFGSRAKSFIRENKEASKQVSKILKFLES
jgi:glycosyltransferase involved in cell wall biosynthesis